MRYVPADEEAGILERWEVADGDLLGLANEFGDVVAYVHRADGTRGWAYGGPVYEWDGFLNICQCPPPPWHDADAWRFVCTHQNDLTPSELRTAAALARQVGWCR